LFTLSISLKRLAHLELGLLAICQCVFLKTPGQIHQLLNRQQTGAALNESIKGLLEFGLLLSRYS
jgi:hypothetical protein